MLSIESYIGALAPKLTISPSKEVYIDMAEQATNPGFWGVKYNQAVALLAAHIWYLSCPEDEASSEGSGGANIGVTGSITSKREGDLAVSYGGVSASADTSAADSDLMQSRYGVMLIRLRKGCRPFIGIAPGGLHCG